jgi:hypothetical protein
MVETLLKLSYVALSFEMSTAVDEKRTITWGY